MLGCLILGSLNFCSITSSLNPSPKLCPTCTKVNEPNCYSNWASLLRIHISYGLNSLDACLNNSNKFKECLKFKMFQNKRKPCSANIHYRILNASSLIAINVFKMFTLGKIFVQVLRYQVRFSFSPTMQMFIKSLRKIFM